MRVLGVQRRHRAQVDYTYASMVYGNHVRNICAAGAVPPPWVREVGMGKNVTLFSYMVMQHTAHLENLSSYTGTLYTRSFARGREYRLYGIVGVTGPGLPGWIANRVSSFAFRQRYIRAFALRMNATSAQDDATVRWNLSRFNRISARGYLERIRLGDALRAVKLILQISRIDIRKINGGLNK